MNSVFLDTNVLIYSIDEDSKYFSASQKLIYNKNLKLYTSSKNISEMLAVLTRHPHKKISIKKAVNVIKGILTHVDLLFPDEKSCILFFEVLLQYKPSGLKIHDFEIISIAKANGVDSIATFNVKDFKNVEGLNFYPFQVD